MSVKKEKPSKNEKDKIDLEALEVSKKRHNTASKLNQLVKK